MRNWVAPWCRDGRPEGAAMRVLRHTDKFHERLETLYQHFLSPTSLVNDWTQATPCPETERNYMVSFYNSQPALSLHFGLQPCCFFTQLFDPDPTGSCQARRVPKSPLLMLKAWTVTDGRLRKVLALGSANIGRIPSPRNLLLLAVPILDESG
ncbi:unnamed protein product [Durusdinium trenchii]|uniref:Uncharacterized protein n=1 Tax=Durusdinium trenchii TaxID=1381693 RepID=A0ABP0HHL3_9DINO